MDETVPDPRVLRDYAEGRLGTRQALQRTGLADFAELIIALAQHGLGLPKPPATAQRQAHVARARAILQPRLRHGG